MEKPIYISQQAFPIIYKGKSTLIVEYLAFRPFLHKGNLIYQVDIPSLESFKSYSIYAMIRKKMRKNTVRRNFVTIYLREKYKPIFELFMELVKDDADMKKLQDVKRPENYMSASIVQLMHQYNQRRKAELEQKK